MIEEKQLLDEIERGTLRINEQVNPITVHLEKL
jgi:hypothetical protein